MSNGFQYANVTGRPPGSFVAVAARLVPGIARVQREIGPYAQAWREANVAALNRPGPRWIVLGDSMSLGIGASRFDAGWVNQLHDQLAQDGPDYSIVNLAASGARVSDVTDQQLPVWRSLPPRDDDDPRPDLVTLLIGSNDLFRKAHREQLPAEFARLLTALPTGTIVASLPQPRAAAAAANVVIAEAERAGRVVVADMRSGSPKSWKGRLADDHFHPNDLGYADLAALFHRTIAASRAQPAEPPATS